MTDVRDLTDRLEKATEGSRELDAEIALVVAGWSGGPGHAYWTDQNGKHRNRPPEWTKSIDAVLALVEKVAPDALLDIRQRVGGREWCAELTVGAYCVEGRADTLPLAILIALLRARTAENQK